MLWSVKWHSNNLIVNDHNDQNDHIFIWIHKFQCIMPSIQCLFFMFTDMLNKTSLLLVYGMDYYYSIKFSVLTTIDYYWLNGCNHFLRIIHAQLNDSTTVGHVSPVLLESVYPLEKGHSLTTTRATANLCITGTAVSSVKALKCTQMIVRLRAMCPLCDSH